MKQSRRLLPTAKSTLLGAETVAGPVPTLLTVTDVATRLRLKPAAVRALTRRGEIGFYRVGRSIRFRSEDVEAFLERQWRPARGRRAVLAAGLGT
jgi:excisionase family DNA binding protein